MKSHLKNPHTFDMSNYYSGNTFVVGGRDFEREDKDPVKKEIKVINDKKVAPELDWSFLKSFAKPLKAK